MTDHRPITTYIIRKFQNTLVNGCSEHEEWIETAENPTREEIIQKQVDFESVVDGILQKNDSGDISQIFIMTYAPISCI